MFDRAGLRAEVEANVATNMRMGGQVANAVAVGNLDAAIVWNAVAHLRKDKLDVIDIAAGHLPDPDVDAVTSEAFRRKHEPRERTPLLLRPEKFLTQYPPAVDVDLARAYLAKRGLDAKVGGLYDLRYDPDEGRILFPVRLPDGGLLGVQGRSITGGWPKYRAYNGTKVKQTLGGVHMEPPTETAPVVIVEGFLDVLKLRQETDVWPMCSFGAGMSDAQISMAAGLMRYTIVWWDKDRAGTRAIHEVGPKLGPKAYMARGYLSKRDPCSMTGEEIKAELEKVEAAPLR